MKTKTKEELANRLEELGVEEKMVIALCNYFNSNELTEFVDFLEDEL